MSIITRIHTVVSHFETSVMDASMSLNEGKKNILIGGIEEHTPLFVELNRNAKKFNTDTMHPLFEGKTHGIQMGEGSAFFAVSSEKQHAKSCIHGISLLYKPKSSNEVLDKVNSFLATEDTTLDKWSV